MKFFILLAITIFIAYSSQNKIYNEELSLFSKFLDKQNLQQQNQIYWWKYKNEDCGYDDVTGSCQGKSVEECKSICLSTQGCGGFNYPHGILKKTDCFSKKADSTVDLYILKDSPQPNNNWPPLWPHPYQFTGSNSTTDYLVVDSNNFQFKLKSTSPEVDDSIRRYKNLIFPHRVDNQQKSQNAQIKFLDIQVTNPNTDLQMGIDESYRLKIESDGSASLEAPTQVGVLYGLETFSQLVKFDFSTNSYKVKGAPWNIYDKPRFRHREVLIDTSRHFQPVEQIKKIVDSLTFAKVNVLHWHIIDIQSFPFQMPNFPELANTGAFSMDERYSLNDVQDIINYSRLRGVRVVPEFDMPAHSEALCKSHPEICDSSCKQTYNPVSNVTYQFLDKFIKDVASYFPDTVLHLGGDELPTNCWTNSPEIKKVLDERKWSVSDAFSYFTNQTHAMAAKYGKISVGWNEVWNQVGTRLNKNAIIQQWVGKSTCSEATSNGYRCLFSQDPVWYLDSLQTTWEQCYNVDICAESGVSSELCDGDKQLLIGGGGEMWGETADASDVLQTIWPKMAAIAERLWSPKEIKSSDAAYERISSFRCHLNRRAIPAAPVTNANARSAPSGPGSCFDQ